MFTPVWLILYGIGIAVMTTSTILNARRIRKNGEIQKQNEYNQKRIEEDVEKVRGNNKVRNNEKIQSNDTPKQTVKKEKKPTRKERRNKQTVEVDNTQDLQQEGVDLNTLASKVENYRKALLVSGRPNLNRLSSLEETRNGLLNGDRSVEILAEKSMDMNSIVARDVYSRLLTRMSNKTHKFTKEEQYEMDLAAAVIYDTSSVIPASDLKKAKTNNEPQIKTDDYPDIQVLRNKVEATSKILEDYKVSLINSNSASKDTIKKLTNLEIDINSVYREYTSSNELSELDNMIRRFETYDESMLGQRIDEIKKIYKKASTSEETKNALVNELLLIDAYTLNNTSRIVKTHEIQSAVLKPSPSKTTSKAVTNKSAYQSSKAPKPKKINLEGMDDIIFDLLKKISKATSDKERENLSKALETAKEQKQEIASRSK